VGFLARALNVDVRHLRALQPEELREFRDGVTLLAQVDVDPAALTRSMRFRLDALARQASFKRLSELRAVVIALNNVIETHDLCASIAPFKRHQELACKAQELRSRAARLEVHQAFELQEQSQDWMEITFAYQHATKRLDQALDGSHSCGD